MRALRWLVGLFHIRRSKFRPVPVIDSGWVFRATRRRDRDHA